MNGVRRPMIDFHNSEFYGFSEFFYTMEDILKMGGKFNGIQFQRQANVSGRT
jgi:Golgi nucleoside diphosphatase